MRCYDIILGEEQVQLRLTTAKLEEFLKKTDGDKNNPILAVLDALTLLSNRVALLTAALQWPGNKNTIKNGAELLDRLLDNGVKPREISNMILELAAMAGLLDEEELEGMMEANRLGSEKFQQAILDMMAGKTTDAQEEAQDTESPDPTTAPTA